MNKLKKYIPLFVVIAISVVTALAMCSTAGFTMHRLMHLFMGIFLLQFAALKLYDIKGFAKGFALYDLLAKRLKIYGLIYPLLELTLALGYLSGGGNWVYLSTICLMSFGAIGVFFALSKGLNINCACLGTTLKVPLSTVAVTENVSMVLMAITLFFTQT